MHDEVISIDLILQFNLQVLRVVTAMMMLSQAGQMMMGTLRSVIDAEPSTILLCERFKISGYCCT